MAFQHSYKCKDTKIFLYGRLVEFELWPFFLKFAPMKKISAYFLALLALTACNGNDEPDPDPVVSNIVTYEATTDDGSVSTFSFQAIDDSPLITISANWKAPETLKPGTRLLAYYSTSNPGESGPVELKQLVEIPGGEPIDTTAIASLSGEPVSVTALWRSGRYLNLNAAIYFTGKASKISLLVDQSTLGQPTVESYLLIAGDPNGPVAETPVSRMLVASWNIDYLWSLSTTKTLQVNFKDISGAVKNMKFTKII